MNNYRLLESKDHIGNYVMDSKRRTGRLVFTCYLQDKCSMISEIEGEYYISINEGDTTKVSPIMPELVEVLKELPQREDVKMWSASQILGSEYCNRMSYPIECHLRNLYILNKRNLTLW